MDQRSTNAALRHHVPGGATTNRARTNRRRSLLSAGALGLGVVGTLGFFSPAHAMAAEPVVGVASAAGGGGWTVTAAGAVVAFGGAPAFGSEAGQHLNKPIVGIAATSDGKGYYMVASDGGIFSFGDARFYGSTGNLHLNQPVVGIATVPNGGGYWLVAADGGIFAFGDAGFYGSTGGLHLQKPIVGMTSTADGRGYDLVAADGGLFTFGDGHFDGSMGAQHLNSPVVGMATDPATGGYWLVAADGGVFGFGAPFYGTTAGQQIAGIVPVSGGAGYDEVSTSGVVSPFGNGSTSQSAVAPLPVSPTTPAPTLSPVVMPNSIFARPVTSQPVDTAVSATDVSSLVTQYQTYYGAVGVNQFPVYTAAAGQPTTTLTAAAGCNPAFLANIGPVPIPADATSGGSTDDPIIVDQPSTNTDWELWRATESNGSWSACWGGKLSTATSNGVFTGGFGLSASGLSYLATIVTEADVASGQIDHTLALDVVGCNSHTAPAVRGDCSSDPGNPGEGTWFRMPASVPMPGGLTAYGQMVFRALQTYGAVVMDHAGAVMIQAEKPADWAADGQQGPDPMVTSWQGRPEYSTLDGIPWNDLQVIQPPNA